MSAQPKLSTLVVLRDVVDERIRQDAKWGEQNHPNLPRDVKHPCAFFGMPTADAARLHCEDAFKRGIGSYAHVLIEEVCEAIEDAHDPVKLRAELVQVAAVATAWVEKIDRDLEAATAGASS